MKYRRMLIEVESPEEMGYGTIRNNLSESSIFDRNVAEFDVDLSGLTLLYGAHRGDVALREQVARQAESETITPDHVLMTTGAAGALFVIATTLLDRDSHLVVVRPNYATNLETPRAIGCAMSCVDLSFDDAFRLDIDAVERAVTPATRLISVTTPHNPTGTMLLWNDLNRLDAIAEKHRCHLLVDETYRDLTHGAPSPSAASISERVIAVSSLSKAFGTPGLRTGWLISRDAALFETLLAAKEQIGICGSSIDERLATTVLEGRERWLAKSRPRNLAHLGIVRDWIAAESRMEWVEPAGGVVCFPRMIPDSTFDVDHFYKSLLDDHGTYVGAGHWFEMPKHYMRIGFAWPNESELRNGLSGISAALREQD
ncbi:MAG: aminotransferase class I/II-fold pyridoxal phosphate-dependent enzyme [Gemmatimonadaceae bacterium]